MIRPGECPDRALLQAFMAGHLAELDGQRVAGHVLMCDECRTLVEGGADDSTIRQFQADHQRADAIPRPLSDPALRELLYELIDTEPAPPSAPREYPTTFGRFELQEVLGSGAHGLVYHAIDTQLNRSVALKLPRSSRLSNPDLRRRFLREARAVSALHHPHIVSLYDVGEVGDVCYLASAYVPGTTLGRWLRSHSGPVSPELAARIVEALAEGLDHAHRHGVLHRDLKPQNVLLDMSISHNELPFTPKITDFSVAKRLDVEGEDTVTGEWVGTPRYMSPELARGKRDEIGPASDIYALGVVLYEILVERVPIEGETHADTLARILNDEPVPPRDLRPRVPRDLEAICLKCLEKSPRRRYASAGELAEDLRRYLRRQPTVARPVSWWEQRARAVRRRPGLAASIGVTLLAVLLLLIGQAIHSRRLGAINVDLKRSIETTKQALHAADEANQRARESDDATEQLLYVADMRLAGLAWKDHDHRQLQTLLQRHEPSDGRPDRRGIEWWFLRNAAELEKRTIEASRVDLYYLSLPAQRNELVVSGRDGIVRRFGATSDRPTLEWDSRQKEVNGFDISSTGERIATAGDDGTIAIWDYETGAELLRFAAHPKLAFQVRFLERDSLLVTCGNEDYLRFWDARTGASAGAIEAHSDNIEALAISPDGASLATASKDGSVKIWNWSTRACLQELGSGRNTQGYYTVAFSPDGQFIAAGGYEQELHVWSRANGERIGMGSHLDPVHAIQFSPDGQRIATGDATGTLHIWDFEPQVRAARSEPRDSIQRPSPELSCLRRWSAHEGRVFGLLFESDDRLHSVGSDGRIQSWRLPPNAWHRISKSWWHVVDPPRFSAAGHLISLGQIEDRAPTQLIAWHIRSDPRLNDPELQSTNYHSVLADARGELFATVSEEHLVELWDPLQTTSDSSALGRRLDQWRLGPELRWTNLEMSPNGEFLAVLTRPPHRELLVHATRSGELVARLPLDTGVGHFIAFSPDSRRIAVALDDTLLIWSFPDQARREPSDSSLTTRSKKDAESGSLVRIPRTHRSLHCAAFRGDGRLVATGGNDRLVKLWDASTGRLVGTITGHRGRVSSLLFSPDGRSLFSSAADGAVRMIHVDSAELLFEIANFEPPPERLILSPDAHWLACVSRGLEMVVLCELGPSK